MARAHNMLRQQATVISIPPDAVGGNVSALSSERNRSARASSPFNVAVMLGTKFAASLAADATACLSIELVGTSVSSKSNIIPLHLHCADIREVALLPSISTRYPTTLVRTYGRVRKKEPLIESSANVQ